MCKSPFSANVNSSQLWYSNLMLDGQPDPTPMHSDVCPTEFNQGCTPTWVCIGLQSRVLILVGVQEMTTAKMPFRWTELAHMGNYAIKQPMGKSVFLITIRAVLF